MAFLSCISTAPFQAFLDQRGEDYDDCPDLPRLVRRLNAAAFDRQQPGVFTNRRKTQVQRARECERDSGQRADKPVLQAPAEEVPVQSHHPRKVFWRCTNHHTA